MKGFCRKWCHWRNKFVTNQSVDVKVNDNVGRYFQKRGLRQEDHLLPLWFNLVADILALLVHQT
jgi:hypothetical protein